MAPSPSDDVEPKRDKKSRKLIEDKVLYRDMRDRQPDSWLPSPMWHIVREWSEHDVYLKRNRVMRSRICECFNSKVNVDTVKDNNSTLRKFKNQRAIQRKKCFQEGVAMAYATCLITGLFNAAHEPGKFAVCADAEQLKCVRVSTA